MDSSKKLKVIIVGAGIAGLTTARFLRLQGHDVTIFERGALDNATGGQGIHFASISAKILSDVGFDPVRTGAVLTKGFRVVDKGGNIAAEASLDEDSWTALRSDMRDELVRLVVEEEAGLPAVKIETSQAIIDVDPDEGVVKTADGSADQADLIIIADGIHSRLRKCILGEADHSAKKTGMTIYRVAVPIETTKQVFDGNIPAWCLPNKDGKGASALFKPLDGSHRMIVSYPCRNSEYMNISCVLPSRLDSAGRQGGGSWFDDADRREVAESFQDFPEIVKLTRATNLEARVWEMQDIDPLPFWHRGKAITIGDAAHAMTAMLGIGANLAIEDAEAFRLMKDVSPERVNAALRKIESVRRPRTAKVLAVNRTVTGETGFQELSAKMAQISGYGGVEEELKQSGS